MASFTLVRSSPALYAEILSVALEYCDRFLLVDRGGNEEQAATLSNLASCFLGSSARSEWPGTRLYGATAAVNEYRLDQESAALLWGICSDFSEWLAPRRPEDLALLRRDGSTWLGSIAHEGDVFLTLTDDEVAAIRAEHPDVFSALKPDAES